MRKLEHFRLPSLQVLSTNLFYMYASVAIPKSLEGIQYALELSYVRITDHAIREYKLAFKEAASSFLTHNREFRAVAHLEASITSAHRAAMFLRKLGLYSELREVTAGIQIAKGASIDQLKALRHCVEHLDARLINDDIEPGQPFVLTLTAYDIVLGGESIPIKTFALWLSELEECAIRIIELRRDASLISELHARKQRLARKRSS